MRKTILIDQSQQRHHELSSVSVLSLAHDISVHEGDERQDSVDTSVEKGPGRLAWRLGVIRTLKMPLKPLEICDNNMKRWEVDHTQTSR